MATNIEYIIKNIKGKGFSQEKIASYNTLYEVFFKLSKEFLKIKKNHDIAALLLLLVKK